MNKKLITLETLRKFKELQDKKNKELLDRKQDTLVYDTIPTPGSTNLVNSGNLHSALTVEVYRGSEKVNKIGADGQDYTIKQGDSVLATINIARDMVIDSGEIVTATGNEKKGTGAGAKSAGLVAGEKYMKLHISNGDPKNDLLWTNIGDLFNYYQGTTGDKVKTEITGNTIKAGILPGTIDKSDLTSELSREVTSLTGNMSVLLGGTDTPGSVDNRINEKVSGKLVGDSDIATIKQIDQLYE